MAKIRQDIDWTMLVHGLSVKNTVIQNPPLDGRLIIVSLLRKMGLMIFLI